MMVIVVSVNKPVTDVLLLHTGDQVIKIFISTTNLIIPTNKNDLSHIITPYEGVIRKF